MVHKRFQDMVTIHYIGGPTALLEVNGLRFLIDPTFDPPGEYPIGDRALRKLVGPARTVDEIGHVDAVLLSHDHHPDNLDRKGREYIEARRVFSTSAARTRLGGHVQTLPAWKSKQLSCPDGRRLRITWVPARHGPPGSEPLVGEVTGFVLSGHDLPTIYISGDNASLDIVREVAAHFATIDVALLFAGAAKTPLIPDATLTLTSDEAAEAAHILKATYIVPLHFEHWEHFTQNDDELRRAFRDAGLEQDLYLLQPGESFTL